MSCASARSMRSSRAMSQNRGNRPTLTEPSVGEMRPSLPDALVSSWTETGPLDRQGYAEIDFADTVRAATDPARRNAARSERRVSAARTDQAADDARVDFAVEAEHEQIFLSWRGGCFTARIADELEMPHGIRPSGHQQRMPALRGSIGLEQDLKTQAVDPEPLGRPRVAARTCATQVACRQRFHSSIIAEVKPMLGTRATAGAGRHGTARRRNRGRPFCCRGRHLTP